MENNVKVCDVCVIGAGPAGLTSSLYLGRADKSVIIVDKDGFGGQIAKSPKVENIPGFVSISGIDFASNMYEQISNLETVEHVIGEVVLLRYNHGIIIVSLEDGTSIQCKSLIFATGCKPREVKLDTKDLYYCVTCDGPFFKNKPVMVLGSGNTGATYALELANYCKHVYLCDITMNMMCEPTLAKRINENNKITFLPNCTVKSVTNKDEHLESVVLTTLETIKAKAIFSALGMVPQTDIAKGFVSFNEKKYINMPEVPGVFAAGDCTASKVKQVTTAVASGTIAALEAIKYLNNLN